MPKLNWSAPKDATWINATNSMECREANDVYLLLKSSDFVTHDLELVWEGCEDERESESGGGGSDEEDEVDGHLNGEGIQRAGEEEGKEKVLYHLVLRKTVQNWNPASEFRCFVRARQLLCLCQRDLNHYSFLPALVPKIRTTIQDFFEKNLQRSFLDPDFVFDVYVPGLGGKGDEGVRKVWLVDVNPWAVRTDPLLFSWLEILTVEAPERASARSVTVQVNGNGHIGIENGHDGEEESDEDDEVQDIYVPEVRLVTRDDPEAYAFNTPKYSAHKLPKDVVDASLDGQEGLREFMSTWRDIVKKQEAEDDRGDSDQEIVEG